MEGKENNVNNNNLTLSNSPRDSSVRNRSTIARISSIERDFPEGRRVDAIVCSRLQSCFK